MRKQSTAQKNTAPEIICSAPWRLSAVKTLEQYKLEVEFVDGTHGFVDMKSLIMGQHAGVFAYLKDTHVFNQVYLERGVVTWLGKIDLAPDAMYDAIKKHGKWILS